MDEQPLEPQSSIPPEATSHPLGIWLWLLPVIAISAVPMLVVLFAGINALRSGAAMPGEAWQMSSVALGIISGLLIGVGATAAYQAAQK